MSDEPFDAETELENEEAGRHATNLELFLDLVFVFAISQLSKLIAGDISGAGVAKSVLVAYLVWQLWSQFSWLGTAIDLDRDAPTRLAFISSVFPTLFMAISIPEAYGANGGRFGLGLLAGTAWVLGLQGLGLWNEPGTRAAFVQYASLASIAPVFVAVGGFLPETPRIVLWVAACVVGLAGTFLVNRQRSEETETAWRVDPVHFSERHALFVIIALGEVLVAIGAAATEQDMSAPVVGAIFVSAWLASVLWWAYFGFVSRFGEEALRHDHGVERARLARDFFTFGHFPLVVGIAFLASVIEHVVSHPTDHLHANELGLLFTAIVFVAGAFMGLQFRLRRKVAAERASAVVVTGVALATAGSHLSGVAVIGVVAVIVTTMQAITVYRVRPGVTRDTATARA
ncbi:MAG: low temperature requirement protein A [Acidimicrobiales bacterium]